MPVMPAAAPMMFAATSVMLTTPSVMLTAVPMTLSMVSMSVMAFSMMAALHIRIVIQMTFQKSLHRIICRSCCPAVKLNSLLT